jgi:ABC-2 type transport system ATP-binding protein
MRGSTEILRFRGVEKTIGRLKALNGLDLAVSSGEFAALVGPPGAGKTAVLRLAAGLDVPDRGSVAVASGDAARRRGAIGAAIPDVVMEPGRTLRSNLRYAADLQGLNRRYAKDRITLLLESLGLGDRANDRLSSLADPDRRRAEIARALLQRPELLLLGNVTEGLTPSAASELLDEVLAIRAREGMAMLWATTNPAEGAGADRLIVLRRGTVVYSGRPTDLENQHPDKDLAHAVHALTGDSSS